jgi:hypothetical protein
MTDDEKEEGKACIGMPAGYFIRRGGNVFLVVVVLGADSNTSANERAGRNGTGWFYNHMKPVVLMGANREIKKLSMRDIEKVMVSVFLGGWDLDGRLDA